MSSEEFTTNQDVSTSEDNPLIIEINRNIGTSTDEDAVVMPKNVNQEEVKPIENLEEVESREKIVQDQTKDFVGAATGGTTAAFTTGAAGSITSLPGVSSIASNDAAGAGAGAGSVEGLNISYRKI